MFKFLKKYKYIFIIITLVIIFSILYFNYQNAKFTIEESYQKKRELVEYNIVKYFHYLNDSFSIVEKQLNQDMEEKSKQLLELYEENPDVYSWNLEALDEEFEGYHIYVIDENLKVIRSTYAPDLGLDFNRFVSFSKLLRSRLKGDSFAVDRMDQQINTMKISKFSYQPTPDNKYLLELSAKMDVLYPVLNEINVYTEAEKMIDNYQSVEEISFYKYSPETGIAGELSGENEGVYLELPPSESEDVKQVFEEQKRLNIAFEEGNYSRSYFPIFTEDEAGSWWDAFVVGIKYNNDYMLQEISGIRNLFLINGLIMLIVFVVFTSSIVYLLRRFEYMAYHDSLTGLANHTLFSTQLEDNLNEEENKAVIFADINDFEEINARFGHEMSELIIEKAAARLNKTFKGWDEKEDLCRIGGVKFAAVFSGFDSQAELDKAAEEIIGAFNIPLEIGENKFFISLTLGISIYPRDGKDIETLFKKADYALYKAKNEQTDYLIYDE